MTNSGIILLHYPISNKDDVLQMSKTNVMGNLFLYTCMHIQRTNFGYLLTLVLCLRRQFLSFCFSDTTGPFVWMITKGRQY